MRFRLLTFFLWVCLAWSQSAAWGQPDSFSADDVTEQPVGGLLRAPGTDLRVLSWNVAGDGVFDRIDELRTLIRWVDPDLLLLDEATGGSEDAWRAVVAGLRGEADTVWYVLIGAGGGYQRGAVVSRSVVDPLMRFDLVPYPDTALVRLREVMPPGAWERARHNLEAGMAVAGAVVRMGERDLLAVVVDLQCCNTENEWQETRRRIEAREIHRVLREVLSVRTVDGVLLTGDLNTVSGTAPLLFLTGPYPAPHDALVPVAAGHLDGEERWTWDGRGSRFPSGLLDYALYSPSSLTPLRAVVLSTEDLPESTLSALGLRTGTSRTLSDHLPIIVDYRWGGPPD